MQTVLILVYVHYWMQAVLGYTIPTWNDVYVMACYKTDGSFLDLESY